MGQGLEALTGSILPATVIDELKAAGLEDVRELPWSSPPGFLAVGQRGR
jgi:hypothetical protein